MLKWPCVDAETQLSYKWLSIGKTHSARIPLKNL